MGKGTIGDFNDKASLFARQLAQIRANTPSVNWYAYQSMSNIEHIGSLIPAAVLESLMDDHLRLLDVGAADGDLGYFFENQGCVVDFLDNPATNFNDCKGIAAFADALASKSRLVVRDLDRAIDPLQDHYDFALALGLLYHLRNPMGFLIMLAEHAERMVLSTRVANHLPDGTSIEAHSVAYLLRCRESNNDPTNYWIMSPLGLEVMLKRCGWNILAKKLTGALHSNPVDNDADQRMFVYCERAINWRDLGKHHDF